MSMVYDRTQQDIDNARKIIEEKVKNYIPLETAEETTVLRGTFNIETLNRIEKKQDELKKLFNSIGYYNTQITNKTDWQYSDIFYKEDYERIINNENILREAFFIYKDTPNTPTISFGYEDINALEKILVDLEQMITDVKSNYRQCGTFNCGE